MIKLWDVKTFTKFVVPVEVKISPNGEWLAYTIKRIDPTQNKTIRQIVLTNVSDERKYYLEEGSSKPRFSPDSKKLSYLYKDENTTVLRIIELTTFSKRDIFKSSSITKHEWAPNSRNLLVVVPRKRGDNDLYFETSLPVWFDGKGFLDDQKDVIEILDVESCQVIDELETKNLVTVFWINEDIVYTLAHEREPFTKFDIWIRSKRSNRPIMQNCGFVAVGSADNGLILFGRERKILFQHDYVYLFKNGQIIPLTEKFGLNNSGHVSLEIWAADTEVYPVSSKEWIYFKTGQGGSVKLERVSLKDLSKQTLYGEKAVVSCFDTSQDDKVAFVAVDDKKGAEVYLWENGFIRNITTLNEQVLSSLKVQPMEHLRYESFDGKEIDAWYIKPDQTSAPMIVFVHGGPKGAYGYCLYFLGQLLAQEGFYVLYTNPRGSDNYDETFAMEVREKTGLEDFKDIMRGVEEMKKRHDITDVGITGISYGGFMTNWAITQTDIFKAAVSENGISYWLTSYAFSDIGFWFDKALIGEDPLNNESYKRLSPLFYAKNVTTPLLLIHSLEDYRCPLDQSLMFYHVLKDLGKEVYIAIFKKGAHGHSVQGTYSHRLKRYKLIVEFFKQKLLQKRETFDPSECFKI